MQKPTRRAVWRAFAFSGVVALGALALQCGRSLQSADAQSLPTVSFPVLTKHGAKASIGTLPDYQLYIANDSLASPELDFEVGGTVYPLAWPLTVYSSGTAQPFEHGINFTGTGVSVADDSTNKRTTVTFTAGTGTVTSVGLSMPSWFSVSGSPVTSSGTLAVTAASGQTSHQFIGTGTGSSFGPVSIAAADLAGSPAAGKVLSYTGSALQWSTVSATPGGSNTQVQYNNGGAFAGSANLTFDGTNLTEQGYYAAYGSWGAFWSGSSPALGSVIGTNGSGNAGVGMSDGGGHVAWMQINSGTSGSLLWYMGGYASPVQRMSLDQSGNLVVSGNTQSSRFNAASGYQIGGTNGTSGYIQGLQYSGGIVIGSVSTIALSADASEAINEHFITYDCSSAAHTFTLLPAAGAAGADLVIVKTDSSANALTISAALGSTINGASTYTLSTQYQSVHIFCDGSNWYKY